MAENRHGPDSVGAYDDSEIQDGNSSSDVDDLHLASAVAGDVGASSSDRDERESESFSGEDIPGRQAPSRNSACGSAAQKGVAAAENGHTGSDVKSETTSVLRKVFLTAQLTGNEANTNSQQLFTVPNLQLLGMPLKLIPLAAVCVGPTLLLLLPLLGWYSDRGNNPRHRKLAIGILSILLVTSGAVCVVVANVLHIRSYLQLVKAQTDNTSLTPWPRGTSAGVGTNISQDSQLMPKIGSSWTSATNRMNTSRDNSSLSLTGTPFKAWLGMAGFVQMDIAFELSNAFVKAWVIMCTARPEHSSVLTVGTLMSAVGGLLTSCLSVVELRSLFQFSDDLNGVSLAVDVITVMIVVIVLFLAGGVLTIVVGFRQLRQLTKEGSARGGADGTHHHKRIAGGKRHDKQKRNSLEVPLLYEDGRTSTSSKDEASLHDPLHDLNQRYGACSSETSHRVPSSVHVSTIERQEPNRRPKADSCSESVGNYKAQLVLTYASMYFSTAAITTFTGLSTDYVGKAIYGGDPEAEPGSDSLRKFQTGVWYAILGFIIYYTGYLIGSACHKRVRELLGHRLEYSVVLLSVSVSLVTLALTARIEVFYVVGLISGLFRATYFNIPFIVLNDIIQEQALRTGKTGSDILGLAMAVAAGMASLSYSTLYPCTIALEHATGIVSMPLWMCATCACIVMILFLLVKKV